jgi:hypothetical protein
MTSHTTAVTTGTVALDQVLRINVELRRCREADADPMLTAELLGLTGAAVHPRVLDRSTAATPERRQRPPAPLDALAPLRRLVATGGPGAGDAPVLYGIFAELYGRRELPVTLHPEQLRVISSALGLEHHRWEA